MPFITDDIYSLYILDSDWTISIHCGVMIGSIVLFFVWGHQEEK